MPVLYAAGADIIQRISSIDDAHALAASISLSWKPLKWLAFQPFYNYEFQKYQTPNQMVNHSVHNAGMSMQIVPGNWQVIWNGNLPMTLVDGDLYTRPLLLEIWGDDDFFNSRSLQVFISRLRRRLEPDPRIRIVNVRGEGYKLLVNE